MEFKDRIKELRLERGLSQQALADGIYISRSAIAKWENGLGLPSKESLRLLSEFLGIEEQELLKELNYEKELVSKNIKINRMKLWICLSCVAMVVLIAVVIALEYIYKAEGENHLIYNDMPIVSINGEEISFYQIGYEYKIDGHGDLKRFEYTLNFPGMNAYSNMNLIGKSDVYQINVSNFTGITGNFYYLNEDYSLAEETTGWTLIKLNNLNIENEGTFSIEAYSYHYVIVVLYFEFPDLSVNYYFMIDLT
jgi:transcriptional regulator with XRE-family HTH domain